MDLIVVFNAAVDELLRVNFGLLEIITSFFFLDVLSYLNFSFWLGGMA